MNKKKRQLPKPSENTGDKHHKNSKLSETVKKWAVFLVAHGCTQTEAAERINAAGCKITQSSVSKACSAYFNESSPFPIPVLSNDELINMSRQLLMLYQQETLYQKPSERDWKDVGIIQKNLYVPIWEHEKVSLEITLKEELKTLERIMSEEKLPQKALEMLQARYDRMNEELKG